MRALLIATAILTLPVSAMAQGAIPDGQWTYEGTTDPFDNSRSIAAYVTTGGGEAGLEVLYRPDNAKPYGVIMVYHGHVIDCVDGCGVDVKFGNDKAAQAIAHNLTGGHYDTIVFDNPGLLLDGIGKGESLLVRIPLYDSNDTDTFTFELSGLDKAKIGLP